MIQNLHHKHKKNNSLLLLPFVYLLIVQVWSRRVTKLLSKLLRQGKNSDKKKGKNSVSSFKSAKIDFEQKHSMVHFHYRRNSSHNTLGRFNLLYVLTTENFFHLCKKVSLFRFQLYLFPFCFKYTLV